MSVALAGCSGAPAGADDPATTEPTGRVTDTQKADAPPSERLFTQYVALGDSYTAAPLTPGTDLAGGCFRSNRNYPAMLAERLGVPLVDASCSGADTADVTQAQSFRVPSGETVRIPPQERALTERTDLVTIGLGGNDENLFGRFVSACAKGSVEACESALESEGLADTLDTITDNLSGMVDVVRDRVAGDAVIVLVGYPRLAPRAQSCPALPVAASVLGRLDAGVRGLNAALRQAAEDSDIVFLDLYRPSRGRDVCSDRPWINGVKTVQNEALALHPFAVEQRAVARLLEPVVRTAANQR